MLASYPNTVRAGIEILIYLSIIMGLAIGYSYIETPQINPRTQDSLCKNLFILIV
jgi:hypothetical protein